MASRGDPSSSDLDDFIIVQPSWRKFSSAVGTKLKAAFEDFMDDDVEELDLWAQMGRARARSFDSSPSRLVKS